MIYMKNILYTIILCLLSTNLLADATQGEMFGLKIGDQYPVNKSDVMQPGLLSYNGDNCCNVDSSRFQVLVTDPKKPKHYGKIFVELTTMSYSIAKIHSVTCFDTKEKAKIFFREQKRIFDALYPIESNVLVLNRGLDFNNDSKDYQINIFQDITCVHTYLKPNYGYNSSLWHQEAKEYEQYIIKNSDTEGL